MNLGTPTSKILKIKQNSFCLAEIKSANNPVSDMEEVWITGIGLITALEMIGKPSQTTCSSLSTESNCTPNYRLIIRP